MTASQRNDNETAMKPDYHALAKIDPRYRTLKNGAIFDKESKRIVAAPPKGKNTFDNRELAREANRIRQEKRKRAVEKGLARAAKGDYWDGIEKMTYNIARMAMNNQSRAAVAAYQSVLKSGDFMQDDTENRTKQGITFEIGQDVLIQLLEYVHNSKIEF